MSGAPRRAESPWGHSARLGIDRSVMQARAPEPFARSHSIDHPGRR
jgi:hypothetical protein